MFISAQHSKRRTLLQISALKMKFIFFLIITSLLCLQASYSQTCQWAQPISGTGENVANSTAVDGSGNVYVTGWFTSPNLIFNNGITLTKSGLNSNTYIAKYNSIGLCQWVQKISGRGAINSFSIAVDVLGNVYVAGRFISDTIFFDSNIWLTNGSKFCDAFFAKYNTSGTCQWAQKISGSNYDVGNSLTVDSSGNVFVAGVYDSPTLNFNNGIMLTKTRITDSTDGYFAKYNSAGICQWAQGINGTSKDVTESIIVGGSGNIFVAGEFSSPTLNFNNGVTLTNNSNNAPYIAKYDSGGSCQWAERISGSYDDYAYSIGIDGAENVYVAGAFSSPIISFNNGISLYNGGDYDAYISKYDSSGTCQWAQQISGASYDAARSIAVDRLGNSYVTGNFYSLSISFNNGVSLDDCVGGDTYISKYNSNGSCQWAQKIGGIRDDRAGCIAVNDSGSVFVAGYFQSEILYFSKDIWMFNNGYQNCYVARYNQSPINTIAITTISPLDYCQGASVSVPFSISGTYNTGNTFTAQLSDATGSFLSPTTIGNLTGTLSGIINAIIPPTTAFGTGYRIRVVSSEPVVTGIDNGTDITINLLPTPVVIGTTEVCENHTAIYSLDNPNDFTNEWRVSGGQIQGSNVANSISVLWNNSGKGVIRLIQTNTQTGCKDSVDQNIIINPTPIKPVIIKGNNEWASTTAVSYQWYFYDEKIEGANKQYYKPTKLGFYKVEITDENGCSSMSDPYYNDIVDVKDNIDDNFNMIIVPNPAMDYIEFTLNKGLQPLVQTCDIRIYNVLGECVKKPHPNLPQGEGVRIDVSDLPPGLYIVRCGGMFAKFVKQ